MIDATLETFENLFNTIKNSEFQEYEEMLRQMLNLEENKRKNFCDLLKDHFKISVEEL